MNETANNELLEFDGFVVDPSKRLLLSVDGSVLPLMPKAFDTLLYLVTNNGRIIEKDELMSEIWTDTIVEENNLNQNISILRRVLGEKRGDHRYIATIPGRGYKFVADVRTTRVGNAGNEVELGNEHRQTTQRTTWLADYFLPALVVTFIGLILVVSYLLIRNAGSDRPSPPIRTMAVLPFKPLVPENRDEVLELGIADTLISRLGTYGELTVFPLSSVRKFGGLDQDPVLAGRSLGADSVLDGSIQRWGDKIRVNARLLETVNGSTLWTGTFDEEFTDIFVVQDTIAQKVVNSLALKLTADERVRLERRSTSNPEAYELYLRGQYHYFKITPPEVQKAIDLYKQAIEVDPNYALAYAALADAYRTQAIAAHAPSKLVCPQAKAMALRALEIDNSLAEAYTVLGWIGFQFERDWAGAESNLKKAMELSPNDFRGHLAYAHLLSNLGRHDEAIAEGEKARKLAPLTHIVSVLQGFFLLYGGHQEEAINVLKNTVELDPGFWVAHSTLGRVYIVQGRFEEAIAELTLASAESGGSTEPMTQLGFAQAKAGHKKEALAVLKHMNSMAERGYIPNYFLAVVYHGLNENEKALDLLELSSQEREVQLEFINIDSRWDDLRSNERFDALISQLNLPGVTN